ncbi:Putative Molybdenum cofactor biosynthesis protein small subunit [Avibacterium paragallinarum JF4211]|nr:Putative Molybdenum cofactor biosynthesis protein small subunit [Avibacterium paragallinarum JF4211]
MIGVDSIDVNEPFANAEALRQHLSARGEKWALALDKEKLLVAINQTLASLESAVQNGDEVAFFPPVTGG